MRISQEVIVNSTMRRLQSRLSEFQETQRRLSTGKQFEVASQDVSGMNVSLTLRAEIRALDQSKRNVSDGQSRVNISDSKVQQLTQSLRRARDLALRGSNTVQQIERDALAVEVASIREQMVNIANTTFLGQSVFGGFTSGDAITNVAGTWTYTGDTGDVKRRIGEDEIVSVNVTGDDVFGFNGGTDVFTTLDDLEAGLIAGNGANISAAINSLDTANEAALTGLARLGSIGSLLETTNSRIQEQELVLRTQQSQIEDVDMAEAVMELQTQEVALQATLGAMSRALQPSLVDFLG
jgi:flagellar hook-associated protein 3 FlgL